MNAKTALPYVLERLSTVDYMRDHDDVKHNTRSSILHYLLRDEDNKDSVNISLYNVRTELELTGSYLDITAAMTSVFNSRTTDIQCNISIDGKLFVVQKFDIQELLIVFNEPERDVEPNIPVPNDSLPEEPKVKQLEPVAVPEYDLSKIMTFEHLRVPTFLRSMELRNQINMQELNAMNQNEQVAQSSPKPNWKDLHVISVLQDVIKEMDDDMFDNDSSQVLNKLRALKKNLENDQ